MRNIISFGLVDEHPVFLDERTDSYFMLDRSDEEHFLALVGSGRTLEDDPRLKAALGDCDGQLEIARATCTEPTRSLLDLGRTPRARLADMLALVRLVRKTRTRLATDPIELVLSSLSGARSEWVGDEAQSLDDRALAFAALRKLVPIAPNCLVDSLALLHWLGRLGDGAMLVFGAKLNPFAAHCWVQREDVLLNDRLESVERFCPVRVVRCLRASQ